MIHTALSATHMVDISLRDPGGGEMIKVRLQGTKEDMEWLEKQLSECPEVKITESSETFSNKGTSNAEILIKEGTSCLSDVIASREDVFDYLTKRGFSQEKAFEIAERVRKGRALTTEDKELMLQNNVPNWYVESCDKIKYLFPRSHSISYIVQLWELAYFKIHYPKSFYDEFFRMKKFGSLNDAINQGYESFCEYSNEMLSGFGRHELTIREYEAILLAQEMYARGAEFNTFMFTCTNCITYYLNKTRTYLSQLWNNIIRLF